jgi:hypothetical protein
MQFKNKKSLIAVNIRRGLQPLHRGFQTEIELLREKAAEAPRHSLAKFGQITCCSKLLPGYRAAAASVSALQDTFSGSGAARQKAVLRLIQGAFRTLVKRIPCV